jgi:PAS domain S-box-containing protein
MASRTSERSAAARPAKAVRDLEARLELAIRASNIGFWDWDVARGSVYFSPEWKRQLGYADEELPNRFEEWETRLHPDDRERTLDRIRAYLANPWPDYQVEFRLRHKDGSYRWIHTRAELMRDSAGLPRRLLGCHVDVTDRKHAEAALRESEEKLRLFIEHAPSAIAMFDRDMRYLAYSRRWLVDYGLEGQQLAGRSHYAVFPELPERWKAVHRRCLEGATEKCEQDPFPRGDGTVDWIRWEVHPWRTDDGIVGGLVIFSEVITDRKRAEEALREHTERLKGLSQRLMEAEEAERRAINRELHDRIGQNLSALNLNLNVLRAGLSGASLEAVKSRLDEIQKLIEETTVQVRNVMAELHPPALDDYGLIAALRTFAESRAPHGAPSIEVRGEEPAPRLQRPVELALFRIAQEALTNALKHANARRVEVAVAAAGARIALAILDDGVGVDRSDAGSAARGWGLTIMRERAEAIGARLRIEARPGGGTRVLVELER